MLSRVADTLYWMMRYVERAENVARFVDVGLSLSVDQQPGGGDARSPWEAVIKASGEDDSYKEHHGTVSADQVLHFMSFDRENQNSILTCLSHARENARSVREVIASEMWEALNRAYLMVQRASQEDALRLRPHAFFKDVKLATHLFRGLHEDTMSHNEGWHFARAGCMVERADQGSRIVEGHYSVLLGDPAHELAPAVEPSLVGLLKSMSAYEMYRKKYRRITAARVLEFLLFDWEFPRSVYACLHRCQRSMRAITGSKAGVPTDEVTKRLGRLVARFAYFDPKDLPLASLEEFLVEFRDELAEVDWTIRARFFGTLQDEADAIVQSQEQVPRPLGQ
jgi:uncharacterized alpha-E superfamily protein